MVTRILTYKPHQCYEILQVEKLASDSEIKKSYRKLAVRLHPDKNPHPRASEAFKLLNKAWGVLSDPSKKKIFDQTGQDPDLRFSGYSNSTTSHASGFSRGGGGHGFGGAPNDDIFNMFFGGGPGAQTFTFGGGNGFTFRSFGGGGDPFDIFGQQFQQSQRQRQRQRQQTQANQQREPSLWDTFVQLLPILLILLASLLTSVFSGESEPQYSFEPSRTFNQERKTPRFKIKFYVNDKFAADKLTSKLANFDAKVEQTYVQDKRSKCSREQVRKNELIEDAQGWFYTDHGKLAAAEKMPMPNCHALRNMGLL